VKREAQQTGRATGASFLVKIAPQRFRRVGDNARTVLLIDQPYANHNGGDVTFGPDGMLYIGMGDGGSGGDPNNNGQTFQTKLAKIWKLDIDKRGAQPQLVDYGLRNPWRFSFDRATGDLYIGDVGQSAWEEIDYATIAAAQGANFGWDAYEGYDPLVIPPNCPGETATPLPEGTTFPVHAYAHHSDDPAEQRGCAVIGGVTARDPRLPTLYGRYLYSDLCSSALRSFVPATDPATAADDHRTGVHVRQVSSITSGRGHRLYVTSLSGPVLRIEPARHLQTGALAAAGR